MSLTACPLQLQLALRIYGPAAVAIGAAGGDTKIDRCLWRYRALMVLDRACESVPAAVFSEAVNSSRSYRVQRN